ncbi:unnamed protein product [Acanthosepion pharaonis]|uniref:Uncharacterized protein n=1 Tax=Acanthosepion pharaonis TaxID=158019 RepID=A0A812DI80_ACAPH|nr:unnamed protein product [Sepia pharaonis]
MHTSCEREAPSRQRTRKKDLCSCPPFRSTNPTKTEFGAIIRATTQNDCDLLSAATQANQRQGTNECITRLNSTNNKNGPVLIKYICDFYPSITEKDVDIFLLLLFLFLFFLFILSFSLSFILSLSLSFSLSFFHSLSLFLFILSLSLSFILSLSFFHSLSLSETNLLHILFNRYISL